MQLVHSTTFLREIKAAGGGWNKRRQKNTSVPIKEPLKRCYNGTQKGVPSPMMVLAF